MEFQKKLTPKQRRELVVLALEYENKFGEMPPLLMMSDPVEQVKTALISGRPFSRMPGDPGIPSDAVF